MAVHKVLPKKQNVYGSLSAEFEPILEIESGDTVQFATLDAGWGTQSPEGEHIRPFNPSQETGRGHALCGPVKIAGAKKGMTLAVRVNDLVPGPIGFTSAGHYPNWQNEKMGLTECKEITLHWQLDKKTMIGKTTFKDRGFSATLRPFMGIMGMPPEEKGMHRTVPPRFCGGNIDCKELTKGSTLYLPVPVDGGYFYVGDGHGAQGDGEISCTAIECPMELVDLTFKLHEDMHLERPIANTPNGWITFGFDEDLNEATVQAMDGMLNLMGNLFQLNRVEAMALGSVAVDLKITQVVNQVKGVHAILPHGALR